MTHIDEHIIELFVLRSATVDERRGEIERHLAECHGCRSLASEIGQFYRDTQELLNASPADIPVPGKTLVRRRGELEPYYEPYAAPAPYRPSGLVGTFRWLVRRHPVAAGAGSFALAAALGAFIFFQTGGESGDKNPAYAHINPQAATLEVYNREHQKLWELPSGGFYQLSPADYDRAARRVVLADLDDDGLNEVIAAIEPGSETVGRLPLSIYSPAGRLLSSRYFRDSMVFRGATYAEDLTVASLLTYDYGDERGTEIFVLANCGRSPNTLFRLAVDGSILGSYAHFGTGTIQRIALQGRDEHHLVFFGQNDVGEPDSLSYPVMIVLDPEKITGKTEAGDSRGFGLAASNAEHSMIRFPLSNLNRVLAANGYAGSGSERNEEGRDRLEIGVRGSFNNPELGLGRGPAYYYQFDPGFNILQVKYESATENLRQALIREGKIPNQPVEQHLAELKNGVRYWNGATWQKEVTTVRHRPEVGPRPDA